MGLDFKRNNHNEDCFIFAFQPALHHYLLRVEKKGRAGRFTRSQRLTTFSAVRFSFFRVNSRSGIARLLPGALKVLF
jgi:hypothetical protein